VPEDRFDPAVRIVEPDPRWPAMARRELRRIGDALGDVALRLEHIGSTAVPGLAAKPIVDLQVSVAALEPRERHAAPLEALGYAFALESAGTDRHFFALPPERPRTYHAHVCEAGGEEELRHLAVRDFLRAHPREAAAYAAVKREVAAHHPQDRLGYIDGKHAYVAALDARAVRWAGGGG
jgi:GrpB-like predicted nucleotidyltransferase (UPF0157 family)